MSGLGEKWGGMDRGVLGPGIESKIPASQARELYLHWLISRGQCYPLPTAPHGLISDADATLV